MPSPTIDSDALWLLYEEHGRNAYATAKTLGMAPSAMQARIRRIAKKRESQPQTVAPTGPVLPTLPDGDVPTADIIELMCRRYEARAERADAEKWFDIAMPDDLPFGLCIFGDPHLDSNGCNWPLLKADCRTVSKTAGLYGVDLGDVVDGWGQRLAHLYAYSDQSQDTAIRLVRWFYRESGVNWLVRVFGNHDQMRPDMTSLLRELSQHDCPMLADDARFTLKAPNGQAFKVWARHNFSGHSRWNTLHGSQVAAKEKDEADLYICGHLHNWALHEEESAHRGWTYWLARARGYKHLDEYATRLGHDPQRRGSSIVMVCDPMAPPDEGRVQCFSDVSRGAWYLTQLRRKRGRQAA